MKVLFAGIVLLMLGACKNAYYKGKPVLSGEETYILAAEISGTQFTDIPVPASFQLQNKNQESFGSQVGNFRHAHLVYHGELTSMEAAAYLKSRMPEHGWQLISESDSVFTFLKGETKAHCALSNIEKTTENNQLITKLLIDVRTGKG